jgi:threonine dehydratase
VFADVTADDVRRAADRLRGIVYRTDMRRAERLSQHVRYDVWLKLENEQLTGSFKMRGAYNAIATLSPGERARGVVTASAGNHGRGTALAAQQFGIPATIFVPRTAPRVKIDGMRECNATIDADSAHYDDAHARAVAFAAEHDVTYLDPCTGAALVAGQGTVALEIVEQLPNVASVIIPVGGGGLLRDISLILRCCRHSPTGWPVPSMSTGSMSVVTH